MTNVFTDRPEEDTSFYPLSPTYLEFMYACAKLPDLVCAKISPNVYRHESRFKSIELATWAWNEIKQSDLAYKHIDVCFGADER